MAMYFREPFAAGGDRSAIPVAVQPDGSISYTDGYGIDYQLDPSTPPGLNVARLTFNELHYQEQLAIQQYQQFGFPDFIASADNGGSPFSYSINATVRYANGWAGAAAMNYYSLADANTADPTDPTKWGLVSYGTQTFITGDMLMWAFSSIRTGGWVWMNGTTIGDVASGATGRANADTSALFALLWTDYSNAVLPIQDSSGTASARGGSAAADFAAHKRLPMPDYRGRSFFGIDNMGGASAAGRITNGESGINGTTLGANGGAQSVALTSNQNGTHTHTGTTDSAGTHTHAATVTDPGHRHGVLGTTNVAPADLPVGGLGAFSTASITGFALGQGAINYYYDSPSQARSWLTIQSTGISVDNASNGLHNHNLNVASSGLGSTHQNMPPTMIGGGFIMKL